MTMVEAKQIIVNLHQEHHPRNLSEMRKLIRFHHGGHASRLNLAMLQLIDSGDLKVNKNYQFKF